MKKVLFVATITGHINSFHIPYLKWFKEQGYEVHVASRGNDEIECCDKHYNLLFERFPLKLNNLKTYKELKKIINKNDYEIIHCHTPVGGFLTRVAAKKARRNGTKVYYTAHGFHFYKGAPLLNWIIYYPIEKICSHYTDCLITITNEDYELAKRKMKAKRIEHINGVGMNTERFQKELKEKKKVEFRKSLNINKDDIVFSYVAELNKNKNQIMLINCINELKKNYKNVKLLIVGDGPLEEEYRNTIDKLKLQENVFLLGKRSDINEILQITDIYLASSIREGLPVNVMEAMYVGLPIIAKDNRGHRELVVNNENGFIISRKTTMKKRIEELINNEILIKDFSKKSKQISEKYVIGKIKNKMCEVYLNDVDNVNL